MKLCKKSSRKLVIGLTPLIDVVFILFVFFMLSSSFTKWNTLQLSVVPNIDDKISTKEANTSKVTLVSSTTVLLDSINMPFPDILRVLEERIDNSPQHIVLIEPEKSMNLQDFVTKLKQLQFVAAQNLMLIKKTTKTKNYWQ